MGAVYRARDRLLGRTVALKIIRPEAMSPALRARFDTEARAIARLDHPHIVRVYDVGDGPVPYLTLEYVEGGTLARRLATTALAPAEAARLVALLARALQHAHDRGIVHRDLKPDNVLMAPAAGVPTLNCALGCPKISDFGLARELEADRRLSAAGQLLGTPNYMAPEQADQLPDVGPPADTYALGVLLYRLLSGVLPFTGGSLSALLYHICHEPPPALRPGRPEVPLELEALCLECLSKRPPERPTAAQLAGRLERFLQGQGVTPAAEVRAARRPLSRRAALIAAAGLGVAGASALGWLGRGLWASAPDQAEVPLPALRVRPLKVAHYETQADRQIVRGLIGQTSFAARHGDAVTLAVELSAPSYFYVIGFNFDGTEQLLWPVDDAGEPSAARRPPRLERLRHPSGDVRLYLDDKAKGGLQVYVVAASSRPLPPYERWRSVRPGVKWAALAAGETVWQADPAGCYAVLPGAGVDRGGMKPAPGLPPLVALCRALAGGGVEAVEAIAFPVNPG
jgi:hypothetical protein